MGGGLRPGGCVSCAPGWTVAARTEAPRAVPVGPPRHQRSAQVARAGGDAAAGGAGDGAARWAPGRSGNAAQRPLSARRRGVGAARRRERGGERGPRGRPPTVFSHQAGQCTLCRWISAGRLPCERVWRLELKYTVARNPRKTSRTQAGGAGESQDTPPSPRPAEAFAAPPKRRARRARWFGGGSGAGSRAAGSTGADCEQRPPLHPHATPSAPAAMIEDGKHFTRSLLLLLAAAPGAVGGRRARAARAGVSCFAGPASRPVGDVLRQPVQALVQACMVREGGGGRVRVEGAWVCVCRCKVHAR